MMELSEFTNELEIAKKIGYNGGIIPRSGICPFEKKNAIPV
jgi:ribosome modulation factor